jgi:putative membrane protein
MEYKYILSLHIIFVVCWFAALFYMVRLFIYTTEAQKKDEIAKPILTQQLLIMQKKLWYIIGWPAMIGTFIFGFWMLFSRPILLTMPWIWLKLISVGILALYQFECQRIYKQQTQGVFRYSSFKLRLFNELSTVLLVAIVFLAIVKSSSGLLWGLLGLFAFAGILMLCVFIYKRNRDKELKATKEENKINNPQQPPIVKS